MVSLAVSLGGSQGAGATQFRDPGQVVNWTVGMKPAHPEGDHANFTQKGRGWPVRNQNFLAVR